MSRAPRRCLWIAAAAIATVGSPAQEPSAPGLLLTLQRKVAGEGSLLLDRRVADALALRVARRESPSPFLEPGMFEAVFDGWIEVPLRDDWTFGFLGSGNLVLSIDGKEVLSAMGKGEVPVTSAPVRLRKGRRAITARYRTPLTGEADLRVTWESAKWPRQTLPPTALYHDPQSVELGAGVERRRAREVVARYRCTACHALPTDLPVAMPELAMRGPDLTGVGDRLEPAWIAAWLRDPRALRSSARMPAMLHGESALADARDLAAWLRTQSSGSSDAAAASGDAERGAAHFRELGCFTCHATDAGDDDAWIDLTAVTAKYRPGLLAKFLLDPRAHDPWIRMPDLRLSEREAADLESYLRATIPLREFQDEPGDAERGRARFVELRCAACHTSSLAPNSLAPSASASNATAKPLSDVLSSAIDGGCVGTPRAGLPHFALSASELTALRSAKAVLLASLSRDDPTEFASRQLRERRCDACHQIGAQSSLWTMRESLAPPPNAIASAAESGAEHPVEVAQNRPALTHAGERLQLAWLTAFLRGEVESPRPWLRARMPRLEPALASGLARGLAARHGLDARETELAVDPAKAVIGKDLVQSGTGFGCVTCHSLEGVAPTALFEVAGIDLAWMPARLRDDFYRSWMLDPTRYDAASKMPRFMMEDGKTGLAACDRDAAAQFEAIWHYLHTLTPKQSGDGAIKKDPR
jgi:cytochrome c2